MLKKADSGMFFQSIYATMSRLAFRFWEKSACAYLVKLDTPTNSEDSVLIFAIFFPLNLNNTPSTRIGFWVIVYIEMKNHQNY